MKGSLKLLDSEPGCVLLEGCWHGRNRSQSGCHALKINHKFKPKMQRRRPIITQKYEAIKSKVDRLLENGFNYKGQYPVWIYNLVLGS